MDIFVVNLLQNVVPMRCKRIFEQYNPGAISSN